MLNKRGFASYVQILILVFGIIAISYAIGGEIKIVRGEVWTDTAGIAWKTGIKNGLWCTDNGVCVNDATKKSWQPTPNTPPATGTPAGYSDHGYVGQAGEAIAGAESVAPKGYEWVVNDAGKGSWKPTGSATASSGLGYSITGILQGALWGLIEKN